ncbi:hypothetical protein Ancab_022263 [Ancistrocladus abbreviatus]
MKGWLGEMRIVMLLKAVASNILEIQVKRPFLSDFGRDLELFIAFFYQSFYVIDQPAGIIIIFLCAFSPQESCHVTFKDEEHPFDLSLDFSDAAVKFEIGCTGFFREMKLSFLTGGDWQRGHHV